LLRLRLAESDIEDRRTNPNRGSGEWLVAARIKCWRQKPVQYSNAAATRQSKAQMYWAAPPFRLDSRLARQI